MNAPIANGTRVQWRDAYTRKTDSGVVVDYRRAAKHAWMVLIVRMEGGEEAEVHESRVKITKGGR